MATPKRDCRTESNYCLVQFRSGCPCWVGLSESPHLRFSNACSFFTNLKKDIWVKWLDKPWLHRKHRVSPGPPFLPTLAQILALSYRCSKGTKDHKGWGSQDSENSPRWWGLGTAAGTRESKPCSCQLAPARGRYRHHLGFLTARGVAGCEEWRSRLDRVQSKQFKVLPEQGQTCPEGRTWIIFQRN